MAGRKVQTPWPGHEVLQATQCHCPADASRCEFPFAAETKEHLCRVALSCEVTYPKFLGIWAQMYLGPSFSRPQGCQLLEVWFSSRPFPLQEHLHFLQPGQGSSCSHQHPASTLLQDLLKGRAISFLSPPAPSAQPCPDKGRLETKPKCPPGTSTQTVLPLAPEAPAAGLSEGESPG